MTERPNALRRFLGNEKGSFTVEAVVIFPILVWAYTAMFVFWDAFRTQNVNLKATYTIADMISREQEPICTGYLQGARSIYAFLNSGHANHQLRVSNVRLVPDADNNPTYEFWSYATEGFVPYTDVLQFQHIIPVMALYDSVIIVSTATDWRPLFNAGLEPMRLTETVVTSPRFAPQIQICPAALS